MAVKPKNTGNKKDDSSFGAGIAVGAGIIAAIAGGYFLYGPDGKTNRKKVRAWAIKARGEVLSEIEKMKEVTAEKYDMAVEKVLTKYSKVKDITGPEIDDLKSELKRYWKKIQTDMKQKLGSAKPKKTAKK